MAVDEFEPLDPEYVRERLSKPPFISIPGVDNVRDLGSYPTKYPGMVTKPRLLYRAGEISNITEDGAYILRSAFMVFTHCANSDFHDRDRTECLAVNEAFCAFLAVINPRDNIVC